MEKERIMVPKGESPKETLKKLAYRERRGKILLDEKVVSQLKETANMNIPMAGIGISQLGWDSVDRAKFRTMITLKSHGSETEVLTIEADNYIFKKEYDTASTIVVSMEE